MTVALGLFQVPLQEPAEHTNITNLSCLRATACPPEHDTSTTVPYPASDSPAVTNITPKHCCSPLVSFRSSVTRYQHMNTTPLESQGAEAPVYRVTGCNFK
ncbi:hypothetical protein E2C01_037444 [Portunus trituberculatus]|uniref:Uncharacterized protein n=1 Tax=Portunus trituberculatus TaxID=210409 RepID=A0A5B7F9D6_PORTR|nr:hypothetical protein [Portunus trituberculatus]